MALVARVTRARARTVIGLWIARRRRILPIANAIIALRSASMAARRGDGLRAHRCREKEGDRRRRDRCESPRFLEERPAIVMLRNVLLCFHGYTLPTSRLTLASSESKQDKINVKSRRRLVVTFRQGLWNRQKRP